MWYWFEIRTVILNIIVRENIVKEIRGMTWIQGKWKYAEQSIVCGTDFVNGQCWNVYLGEVDCNYPKWIMPDPLFVSVTVFCFSSFERMCTLYQGFYWPSTNCPPCIQNEVGLTTAIKFRELYPRSHLKPCHNRRLAFHISTFDHGMVKGIEGRRCQRVLGAHIYVLCSLRCIKWDL
jgi:hypothetical protein